MPNRNPKLKSQSDRYAKASKHLDNVVDVDFWIEYSRVLESSGAVGDAVAIVQR